MPKSCLAPKAQPSNYRKQLPAKTVAELRGRAERIKAALKRSLVEVGRELTEAKAVLSHGQFAAWVERETGMSRRTAQRIMGAYRLCLKSDKLSLLGRSALFLLGSDDVPASTIRAIEKRIDAGEVPTRTDVESLLRRQDRERPSSVSLAIKMNEPADKATVIDLDVHREIAKANEHLAEAKHDEEEREQRRQQLKNQVGVADIAIALDETFNEQRKYRLITLMQKAAADSTIRELAEAWSRL
jgi:hypothetical protein